MKRLYYRLFYFNVPEHIHHFSVENQHFYWQRCGKRNEFLLWRHVWFYGFNCLARIFFYDGKWNGCVYEDSFKGKYFGPCAELEEVVVKTTIHAMDRFKTRSSVDEKFENAMRKVREEYNG